MKPATALLHATRHADAAEFTRIAFAALPRIGFEAVAQAAGWRWELLSGRSAAEKLIRRVWNRAFVEAGGWAYAPSRLSRALMDESEQLAFAALPVRFTVYRVTTYSTRGGWYLDPGHARARWHRKSPPFFVESVTVRKDDTFAVKYVRHFAEVVLFPRLRTHSRALLA